MKNKVFIATALFTAALAAELLACGDKFLIQSRGTRYERSPAARQAAAILIYVNPSSALAGTLSSLPIDRTLRNAGYKPASVTTVEDLQRALAGSKWDLIVLDVADSQTVKQHLPGPPKPSLLPVLFKPTRTEIAEAKRLYRCIVEKPRSQDFVDAIDDAMAAREAQTKAVAKKPAS